MNQHVINVLISSWFSQWWPTDLVTIKLSYDIWSIRSHFHVPMKSTKTTMSRKIQLVASTIVGNSWSLQKALTASLLQHPDIDFHLKGKFLLFTNTLVWIGCGHEIVKFFTMACSYYLDLVQRFHIFWIYFYVLRISTYEVQWTRHASFKMGKRTTTFQSTLSCIDPPTWKCLASKLLEDTDNGLADVSKLYFASLEQQAHGALSHDEYEMKYVTLWLQCFVHL